MKDDSESKAFIHEWFKESEPLRDEGA